MKANRTNMNFFLKEICILLYIFLNYDHYYGRALELGFTVKGFFFVFLFLVALSGLFMVAYIRIGVLRVALGLVFFLFSTAFDSFVNITSSFLTYSSFIGIIDAIGFANEAITQYLPSIITSAAISALLFVGISLKPRRTPPLPGWSFVFTPFVIIGIIALVVFARGGRGALGLPSPFTSLAYSSIAIYEAYNSVIGERKGIELGRNEVKVDYDIILIIDESISANYLDINSEYGVASGLKNVNEDLKIFNYGFAASMTNCSAGTNVSLRYGGTRKDYLSYISTMPSIWQYAKKANLRTVYIDAQRTGKKLQNDMTREELKDVDEFIQFDDTPVLGRDMASAGKLIEYINNDQPELIVINKMGAHFPIHDKYPDHFMVYKPALPRGKFIDISDTGSKHREENFSGEIDDWVLYRNSYRNTILWNVAEFFNVVFKSADLNKAVIIYTSDHGQDLHESGNPGKHTHCSSNPRMEEGLVPLIVIKGAMLNTLKWDTHLADNVNRSSHYNIFPTILALLSYKEEEIEAVYGRSLFKITDDDMTFNATFKARLGREPVWKKIDLNELTVPPESLSSEGKEAVRLD